MSNVMSFRYNTSAVNQNIINYNTRTSIDSSVNNYPIVDISSEENIEPSDDGIYSIYEIANWFLSKSNMTHKKLQKLCYYSQAWYYALHNQRLIDTDFQAWTHGPVSPPLYERFKSFGYNTIHMNGAWFCTIKNSDVAFLEDVWATYGDRDGNALEALTHKELPWIEARHGYQSNERCSVVISPRTMKEYYRSISSG